MCVSIGNIDALVSNAVCDGNCREAHIDQEGDMAMSQVVDSDFLNTGLCAASAHFVMKIGLRDREHSGIVSNPIQGVEIILNFVNEKIGHLNIADTLGSFGICNDILAADTLIGFGDAQHLFFQGRNQRGSEPAVRPSADHTSTGTSNA